uniref:Bm12931 n=1 Tax=Brugia malayi TaxID=6279 RepID=A0A1I9G622_BRUMA|nr:Bm12931 [Brugia malayi]
MRDTKTGMIRRRVIDAPKWTFRQEGSRDEVVTVIMSRHCSCATA